MHGNTLDFANINYKSSKLDNKKSTLHILFKNNITGTEIFC
jgi:hypothetical protein